MQCQPIAASLRCSSLSRSLFLRIFATQNSRFVFGILQHGEFSIIHCPLSICAVGNCTSCPCQKQPFTKMHVLYFLSTKSGCPGSRLSFSLYLNPLAHNPRRTTISGFVSFDRMAAMFLWRCCGVSLSMLLQIIHYLLRIIRYNLYFVYIRDKCLSPTFMNAWLNSL